MKVVLASVVSGPLLSLALVSGLVAQEEPVERFEEELEVTEVLLDVLVTDSKDRVIVGLGPGDFLVLEDGEPVNITSLTFYSSRRLMGSREQLEQAGLKVDEVPEDRYYILFFQDQSSASHDSPGLMNRQLRAGHDARKWIRSEMLPRDWVTVVSYKRKLRVHQDFTRNQKALDRAVSEAVQGKDPGGNWPSRQPAESEKGVSLLPALPVGKELRRQTTTVYEGMEVLARAAGQIRGRKILMFFGIGVGEVGSFGLWDPDPRYYFPMVRTLNDNNVVVYALDVTPLGTRHALERSLERLANETGGDYHHFSTGFLAPMRQIADTNSGYYLLSYQSRHSAGETGYQKVRVGVRNKQLKVRARQGYLYGTSSPQ